MTQIKSVMQKIQEEFSFSKFPDSVSINVQKVKLYLSDINQNQHKLDLQMEAQGEMSNLMKSIFRPQNGIFLIEAQAPHKNYIEKQNFQTNIQNTFSEFLTTIKNQESNNKIQFLTFFSFFLKSQPGVTVFYEKYFDQIQKQVKKLLNQIYSSVSTKNSQTNLIKKNHHPIFDNKNQEPQNKIPESKLFSSQIKKKEQTSKRNENLEIKDPFNYFLKKFYDFYCKKYLNTIKDQQFQKLSEFYNSMNLTKFMIYCKDMKLLKFQKKLTAKILQQMFKAQQNQKRCLQYQSFAKIVRKCLQEIFETQEIIKSKGYETIGVLNRENFVEVMGRLGVLVPLKKTVMVKLDDIYQETILGKSKSKDTIHLNRSRLMKCSSIKNYQAINGHGYESNWDSNELHPDLFLNEKQRKQQLLLQSLSIPKLNKLQPSRHMDEKLHQMVDEQYDPYLKRYNQKSIHQNSNGVLKRMDQRINNIVKKIR